MLMEEEEEEKRRRNEEEEKGTRKYVAQVSDITVLTNYSQFLVFIHIYKVTLNCG
jgi:hypothetical protein